MDVMYKLYTFSISILIGGSCSGLIICLGPRRRGQEAGGWHQVQVRLYIAASYLPGDSATPHSTSGLTAATRGSSVQLKHTPGSFIFILAAGYDAVTNAGATHSPSSSSSSRRIINGTLS